MAVTTPNFSGYWKAWADKAMKRYENDLTESFLGKGTGLPKIDLNCSSAQFKEKFFEKNIKFIPGGLNIQEYGWANVSHEFYGIDPGDARIRLFQNGEVTKEEYVFLVQDGDSVRSLYKEGAVDEALKNGATLVVTRYDRSSIFVSALCQELSTITGERCVGNAYIATGGNGTFGKHWDRHCVFVLQLLGRKLWRIYPPTLELPLQFQTSKNRKEACPLEPAFERVVEAGDIIYIPRGWWHEAIPLEGEPTMHIAAGIHTTSIYEYLRWVGARKAPQLPSARQSIGGEASTEELLKAYDDFHHEFMSPQNLEEFKRTQLKITHSQTPVKFEILFAAP